MTVLCRADSSGCVVRERRSEEVLPAVPHTQAPTFKYLLCAPLSHLGPWPPARPQVPAPLSAAQLASPGQTPRLILVCASHLTASFTHLLPRARPLGHPVRLSAPPHRVRVHPPAATMAWRLALELCPLCSAQNFLGPLSLSHSKQGQSLLGHQGLPTRPLMFPLFAWHLHLLFPACYLAKSLLCC